MLVTEFHRDQGCDLLRAKFIMILAVSSLQPNTKDVKQM